MIDIKDKQISFKSVLTSNGTSCPGIVVGEIRYSDEGVWVGLNTDIGVLTALSESKVRELISEIETQGGAMALVGFCDSTGLITDVTALLPQSYIGRNVSESFGDTKVGWTWRITDYEEGQQWDPDGSGNLLSKGDLVICTHKEDTSIYPAVPPKWTVAQNNIDVYKGDAPGLVPKGPTSDKSGKYLDGEGHWTAPVQTAINFKGEGGTETGKISGTNASVSFEGEDKTVDLSKYGVSSVGIDTEATSGGKVKISLDNNTVKVLKKGVDDAKQAQNTADQAEQDASAAMGVATTANTTANQNRTIINLSLYWK